MKKFWYFSPVVLLLLACDVLNDVEQRLNVLLVNFKYDRIEVGFETPSLLPGNSLDPSKYKILLNCFINANNPNDNVARFDGADFFLRVVNTADADPAAKVPITSFMVNAKSETTLTIPYVIKIDDPLFSYDIIRNIIKGDKIPYRLNADLFFNLVLPRSATTGTISYDTLGSSSVPINLVEDSVRTRYDIAEMEAILSVVELMAKK